MLGRTAIIFSVLGLIFKKAVLVFTIGSIPRKIKLNTDVGYKNLSENERAAVDHYLNETLVDHLYKTALSGVAAGVIASTIIFVFFYQYTSFTLLLSWYIGFNFIQILILALYASYKKFKNQLEMKTWGLSLASLITILTIFYGACVLFTPKDETHQILFLAILFMLASSFSMVSVGLFKLCVASVSFILIPVIAWVFSQDSFYYKTAGGFIVLYNVFLLAMNRRSTEWLKNSIRLSRILASFTHQANYDFLTDLPNQRLLSHMIEQAIQTANEKHQSFAVICFAVNRLEIFNNSLGYQAGDLIINSLAKRLKTELTALTHQYQMEYFLTRPRADAFAILLSPIQKDTVEQYIQQLLNALHKPFYFGTQESRLTASIGVTLYPEDSLIPEQLLRNTYAAMFEAKTKGGNQIVFYKADLTSNAPSQLALESELHQAIERREFVAYYQPIIDLHTGQVSGSEALIRWHHPLQGLVPPNQFIPLAEETGLIVPMGEWILETAAAQTVLWQAKGLENLKIAINLSAKQLHQGNLIGTIDKILSKTNINPASLELELTETAVLDEALAPLVAEIAARGISLAIDDFGTGYSSFSYLKYFHIDKIKIDKSFIDDVTTNNDSATIVSAILAMAKELGIKTLAEGVETKEQLQFLKDRGCRYIQGFYFSKPLQADDFLAFVAAGVMEKL